MNRFHLCSGLLVRDDRVLLVRTCYPGAGEPRWTLPGGRLDPRETIAQAVVREFLEETGLRTRVGALAYVSESIDAGRGMHVVNCSFFMTESSMSKEPAPGDPAIVEVRFVPVADAPALLRADVLRIPVGAALAGGGRPHYFSFREEDVEVPFVWQTS